MVAYLIFGWLISYFLLALIKPLFVRAGWVDEPVRPWHPMGAEVTSGGLSLLGTLFIGLLGLHSGASEIIVVLGTFTLMFGVGFLNGLLAGLTGLVGIVVVIWCQLRNWPKDMQRAIFQPVMLSTVLISAVTLSLAGAVTAETTKLYLLGLPCMLVGTWIGLNLYGKVDDAAFRKIVLLVLLVFGLTLIVPVSMFR